MYTVERLSASQSLYDYIIIDLIPYNYRHVRRYILQFLSCVAPNVVYHLPEHRSRIRGIAVRLSAVVNYLDKHGIPHRATKVIRKRTKRNKRCATTMKQHFLKEGLTITTRKVKRNLKICKGCLILPADVMPDEFNSAFPGACDTPRIIIMHSLIITFMFYRAISHEPSTLASSHSHSA